jgi:hypothetical protein
LISDRKPASINPDASMPIHIARAPRNIEGRLA